MPNTQLHQFTLTPVTDADAVAFAGLRINADTVRVYFGQATDPKGFGPTVQEGTAASAIKRVVPLRGNAGLFADVRTTARATQVELPYKNVTLTITIEDPQVDGLEGQNCLLTVVNQALSLPADEAIATDNPLSEVDYLHSWLAHHVDHHGATAAVLLNRLGAHGHGADFANNLKARLAEDPILGLAHIKVVHVPIPVGKLGAGDERDVIYAPEAPGKNRMTPPPVDPWRAPFGDEVLLEYLHHAMFVNADGVAYLDASDWLAPVSAATENVFTKAQNATPDAVIALTGKRAFPWKIKHGQAAIAGDHICTPFDMKAAFARWVISPAKLKGRDYIWRPHRMIGLKPQDAPEYALWRFSALRHPQASTAQLAPKSSLVENPDLITLIDDYFDHDPIRMPQVAPPARPLAAQRGDKIVLVTAMKNEGPFLLEWIAYHRAIGVSDIVVFSNDCTDGTDTFLDLLAARGIVEHYQNPFREMGLRPQHAGFRAAEDLPTVQKADWLMTLDVDEYINVHVGDGHLRDLFAHVGDANLISCTWRLFGNGDLSAFEDDFVTRQFTRCAHKMAARPHQAWGFKTLYQNNGYFKKLGVHRPKGLHGHLLDQIHWVNGSGQPMPEKDFRNGWRSNTQSIGYDLVSLNHYAVRSVESFLVKRDRGRVNHVDRDQGSAYWFRMNHNVSEDVSIQRMLPTLEAEFNELMSDPDIKKAHAFSVAQHRAKIAELRAQPVQERFFDGLNSQRMRTLSRMLQHFGANVFLAGPDSVPQELVDQASGGALSADFFFTVPKPEDTKH